MEEDSDEGDDYWDNYLELLRIMEFLFVPVITYSQLEYLQALIEDYLTNFRSLYPDRPLVPKMHYLIHMPLWIKRRIAIVLCTLCIIII